MEFLGTSQKAQGSGLKQRHREETVEEFKVSKYENGNRDVHYLMKEYKKATKGESTTDICVLFSFWQSNFCDKEMKSGEKEMSKDFQNLLTAIKTARKHFIKK